MKEPKIYWDSEEIWRQTGTLDIWVKSRMNTEWQGKMIWWEEALETDFAGEDKLLKNLIQIHEKSGEKEEKTE